MANEVEHPLFARIASFLASRETYRRFLRRTDLDAPAAPRILGVARRP